LFFGFGSFVAFSLAAKCTNYDTAYWAQKLVDGSSFNGFWGIAPPTSDQMKKARYFDYAKSMQKGLESVRQTVESFPLTIKAFATWAYIYVAQPLVDAKEGRRVCWTIALVNTGVWLAWQIPRFKPFMMAHFTHHPLSGLSYTMLTAMFSHKSFLHLLFNCMALTSFGSATCEYLMREQAQCKSGLQESTIQYHLIALLISAGMFSGLVSHIVATRIQFPRIIAKLNQSRAQPTAAAAAAGSSASTVKEAILPSLGISGAIYSTVIITALAYPQSEVALIFPPTPPIPIQWGVGALVALDVVGVLRGWRLFDHFAHLGGAAFGVFYYTYGPQSWDFFRTVNPVSFKPAQRAKSS